MIGYLDLEEPTVGYLAALPPGCRCPVVGEVGTVEVSGQVNGLRTCASSPIRGPTRTRGPGTR